MKHEPIVKTEEVSFGYGGVNAIEKISFEVNRGDYIGLIGHNGSGKTTLIKIILGLLTASSGRVSLFGKGYREFNEWTRIGYLPQNISLFNPVFPGSVEEVVALGLLSQKKFPKRFESHDFSAVHRACQKMGIDHLSHKLIGELSGGQQQRVLLARAIVNEPDLLILDEPVNAVDAETREEFFSYLNIINKGEQKTILLVSHDIGNIRKHANKLLLLDRSLVFYGSFEEFCASPTMTDEFGKEAQHIICHHRH